MAIAPETSSSPASSASHGPVSKLQVTPLDQLDLIITDTDLPEDTRQSVEDLGVELRLADIA